MCLSHVGTAAVAAQHCHTPVPQLPYCCLSLAAVCPGVPCVQEGLSCQQRLRKACLAPALPSRSQSVCWLGCGVPGQPGLGALWGSQSARPQGSVGFLSALFLYKQFVETLLQ